MNFSVDKEKAIEALVYIASAFPGVGRFHASKILYLAEREHMRRYGRPIVGDRYIAMENGPVPSFAYDVLKGDGSRSVKAMVRESLVEVTDGQHPAYKAARAARLDYFSRSDLKCLDDAIAYCRPRTFGEISDATHQHSAWIKQPLNGTMDYEDILEGVSDEIVEDARAFASYGVV